MTEDSSVKLSELTRATDGTITFTVTIAKVKVAQAYSEALNHSTKVAEIKGFRKGKAPKETVEKALGKTKLYEHALEHLLPEVTGLALQKHQLKPIISPRLTPIALEADKDWQFKLEVVETPQFELGDYKDKVKGALAATKIWVPGQDKNEKVEDPELSRRTDNQSLSDKRLAKIFDALLDNISVPLPKLLIDDEVNRALSKLLDQIQKLGLTLDQYLASTGKTSKALREDYQKTAMANLKLEFILQEIARDLSVEVEETEIDQMIAAIPDEKTRESFKSSTQRAYVKSVLRKRKTIEALQKLG
ncbi:MAG: hypothetical protein HYS86_04835 [Candidatus Chisholmbacteria bacterium]|nr:hypothetical protein [Candidatus Chisholmbacteria bacterium]